MRRNYKAIIIVILLAVTAIAGYYIYTQYNALKTQELLKTSQNLKNSATTYFNQAVGYENAGDYPNAITMYQKSNDEITKALYSDNQALIYASGAYREYLDNDILLLKKTAKLIEYKIYLNHYRNNSLNPGQEKVNPSMLTPYIDNLTQDMIIYKDKENQIVSSNPGTFKFLNQ